MQTVFIGASLASSSQALLPADVLARFYRQSGQQVLFVASKSQSGQPGQTVDLSRLDLLPDQIVDPENPECAKLVESLFQELEKKNLLYLQAGSQQYFFRLADYSAPLHELLDWSGQDFDPATRSAAKKSLEAGLEDLPVSEKDGRLSPWFFQLAGFLAGSLAWAKKSGQSWQPYWTLPARSVYLGGPSDRTGLALYWPALLEGLNPALKLPDQIMTDITLRELGEKEAGLPADSLRYYLLKESRADLKTVHNEDLAGRLSSFILRVYRFLIEHHWGCSPNEPCEPRTKAAIKKTYTDCGRLLARGSFSRALTSIFILLDQLDSYFTEQDPASLLLHDPDNCDITLATCLDGIVNLSQLLAPFLPAFSRKIRQRLGLPSQAGWEFASCPGGILLKKPQAPFIKQG